MASFKQLWLVVIAVIIDVTVTVVIIPLCVYYSSMMTLWLRMNCWQLKTMGEMHNPMNTAICSSSLQAFEKAQAWLSTVCKTYKNTFIFVYEKTVQEKCNWTQWLNMGISLSKISQWLYLPFARTKEMPEALKLEYFLTQPYWRQMEPCNYPVFTPCLALGQDSN